MTNVSHSNKSLTIAIPTLNGSKTLNRLLDSIFNQLDNLHEVEILVCDNASTDRTKEIALKYPYISYHRNAYTCSADENFCLSVVKSKGEYVWLMGDDDYLEPGAIEEVLKVLKLRKDLGAIFVNYSSFDNSNQTYIQEKWLDIENDIYCHSADEFLNVANIAPNFLSCTVHHRDSFINTDYKKYFGTFWVQYAILLDYLKDKSAYCIAKPYVVNAGDSSEGGANLDGMALHVLCNLMQVINDLPKETYSDISIIKAKDKVGSFLTSKISASRRRGLKINYDVVKKCIKYFGNQPYFWFLQLPLLFMPKSLHLFLYKIYKIKIVNKLVWKSKRL